MAKLRNRYKPKQTPRERQIEDALRARDRQVKRHLRVLELQDGLGTAAERRPFAGMNFADATKAMAAMQEAVQNGSLMLTEPKVLLSDGKAYELAGVEWKDDGVPRASYRTASEQAAAYQYAMSGMGASAGRTAHAISRLTGLSA